MATKPVRILQLIHSSAFGGGPAMVELLCRRLHGDEFEMSLVSSGEGELPARLSALGMQVLSLPLASKQAFVRHLPALAQTIRRMAPDLVHVHGHWAASLGQLALQLAGRPPTIYSVQWPAYLDDSGPYSRVRNWIAERESCQLARRVVAVSEHDRATLVRRRLCSPQKLTVIHNAYDPRFAEPSPGPGNGRSATSGSSLGFIGRLTDQKGCGFLIQAMPEVLRLHPTTTLVIVGDGPERAALEALTHQLRLDGAVSFVGYRPSSKALLESMDLVIVPSTYDVHPLVGVEAMAAGRPVIASAVGGLTETVVDGETGLLVPPRDPSRLAAAIARLLASPSLRAAMGEAATRRALEKFSPEVCGHAYAAEYRSLAAHRARRTV